MEVERTTEKTERAALRERRDEVARLLAERGLARGPRRLLTWREGAIDDEDSRARRLREVLEGLGPILSSFGLYMSTRVDLLSARDCVELGEIRDSAAAMSPDAVRTLITSESGRGLEEVFLAFEESPFESRLFFQKHRARLRDGRSVVVKVRRIDVERDMADDLELLPLLKFALGGVEADHALDAAIEDFRLMLQRKMDFTVEATGLESLARDAETFGILGAASVVSTLCTRRMLTVEHLPGTGLEEVLFQFSVAEGGNRVDAPFARAVDPDDLARRLCVMWLRQALHGTVFPVEISLSDLVLLPGREIGLAGGVFANLPAESQTNLCSYLVAVAGEFPGQACAFLVKDLKRDELLEDDRELQQRFKQVVPFRDSEWNGDCLAHHLFVQWRLASAHGYLPRQYLPPFFRGLYSVARLARQISPARDVFAEAFQDVRLIARMERFKEMLGEDRFSEEVNRYAALMLELPQRMDQALTLAARGSRQLDFSTWERIERQRRKNSSTAMVALLMMLAAFVLLARQVTTALSADWADSIKAVVFVALGAFVLRVASRG